MSILGIVVEYNPFHNGHLYHLKKAKQITNAKYVIAVMSGNFLQRGLPACLDKCTRTKLALHYGVDMVIELPLLYATSAANYFANAAISLLNAVGCNYVCFGAELADINLLSEAITETDDIKLNIKSNLNKGLSYAKSKSLSTTGSNEVFKPNNILGIEYLKALKNTNSQMIPFAIKRNNKFASATYINGNLMQNKKSKIYKIEEHIPNETYNALINSIKTQAYPIRLNNFSNIFHYKLINEKRNINKYLDVTEGLENLIIKKAQENYLLEDILKATKTKRYTLAKLQRVVTHILLNITKEDMYNIKVPPYVRILGINKERTHLINNIKSLPTVINLKKDEENLCIKGKLLLSKEITATDIYYLSQPCYKIYPKKINIEYTKKLITI